MKRAVLIAVFLILSAVLCSQLFADEFPLDKSTVNAFDRFFMNSYNETLDNTATVLEVASLLTPAVLLTEDTNEYVTIGVMYLETAAMAFGTRTLLKHLVERPRPYMYYDNYPQEDDWNRSFPSGHTSTLFVTATSLTLMYPRWYVAVPAYLWAGSVAFSRLYVGAHYPTDVLAGALIGTGCAFLAHAVRVRICKEHPELYPPSAVLLPLSFSF